MIPINNPAASADNCSRPSGRPEYIGAIFGMLALYVAVIGLLQSLDKRPVIVGFLSLGQAMLIVLGLSVGIAIMRNRDGWHRSLAAAAMAGGVAGAFLASLLAAMSIVNLRPVFLSLSPQLRKMLSLGMATPSACVMLVLGAAVLALLGAMSCRLPKWLQRPAATGAFVIVILGVFQELIQLMLQSNPVLDLLRRQIYTWEGLTPSGALTVSALAAAGVSFWRPLAATPVGQKSAQRLGQFAGRRFWTAVALAAILLMPLLAGSYIGQVLLLICLYCLMGMGQNIEIGLAGLLDLGFVAFFAVGAYMTALLTADSPFSFAAMGVLPNLSYWSAMPIAVGASVLVGLIFGIPVLKVRGDYLAVATLALGEIVRVLVQSDLLAPLLGGSKGILQIPKPAIAGFEFNGPVSLFYLTAVFVAVAAYCAWRLDGSRLGRAWKAIRDDEDVAQALGINLVKVKLLAYGLGAAFAGVAGSIFAVMLTQVYPSSFQLQVSINVLVLVVVGGTGSLPGVMVGAAVLVGLPELLREFAEYRFLFYGTMLIAVMRLRPEGIWPNRERRRGLNLQARHERPDIDAIARQPVARPAQ